MILTGTCYVPKTNKQNIKEMCLFFGRTLTAEMIAYHKNKVSKINFKKIQLDTVLLIRTSIVKWYFVELNYKYLI